MKAADQIRESLAALISIQANLRMGAIQTQDRQARETYENGVNLTEEIIGDLKRKLETVELQETRHE
ncbi:DUF1657 domain-containing protein [Brevibacillus fulvus]|uniref:DUF1657 domain-containing protein n=1 Tax=Brevibacillus fulvus TaxID=1125967 RepID=A0A938XX06_9BACL|nr:DUF1657 domain-containing protein [Brevibacillus fulvus]MBM7592043.1 hypothetical protein [Brevibacillus fulvus]